MTRKSEKLCENGGGKNLKSHSTTWPVDMGEKKLVIGRVWVNECLDCKTVIPTKTGKEKIERSMVAFMTLMFR